MLFNIRKELDMDLKDKRIGFAFTGSFCTIISAYEQMVKLCGLGAQIFPVFSFAVKNYDTRFVKANDFYDMVSAAAGREPITTIYDAEPIGPKKLLDAVVVAPCTGNSAAKLANGITDTPVLMAVKAHLRNGGPIVIALASNDAMGANGQNIGKLMNQQNIYLVPMCQDSPKGKPNSLVADMNMIIPTLESALSGVQINPVFY